MPLVTFASISDPLCSKLLTLILVGDHTFPGFPPARLCYMFLRNGNEFG